MNNLAIAMLTFVVFTGVVLAAAKLGKPYLFGLSITFILVSNITVQMNTQVLPGIVISWAIVIYSLVYLVTDLTIEFYGHSTAYRLAALNLSVQVLLWLYVWLSLMATPEPGHSVAVYDTMKALFGTTSQITIAALVAAIGPFADIFVTVKLRALLKRRRIFRSELLNLLARAKLSTVLGEFINTALFFSIALFGTQTDTRTLVTIVVSATLAKWAISLADMPFLWFFFRRVGPPPDATEVWEADISSNHPRQRTPSAP